MKNFITNIFSLTNEDIHKVVTILGFKIKFINIKKLCKKLDKKVNNLNQSNSKNKKDLFYTILKIITNADTDILVKPNKKLVITTALPNTFSEIEPLKYLFNADIYDYKDKKNSDLYLLWGAKLIYNNYDCLIDAFHYDKPAFVMEDGFLKCVATPHIAEFDQKYRNNLSYTINNSIPYFDCTDVSLLEKLLNDKNLVITDEQKARARKCIDKITKNYVTKYNHQPIFTPQIGRNGVKKVLVIDQSYGDMSITRGQADDNTFSEMLQCAIDENPDADIIVKTHPDTIATRARGYFSNVVPDDNVYIYTENINPISLINYCDEVYVCTSQMGFEALMCNKKVHIFGVSFYSGYGLADERQIIKRRTVKRTLEEMFYIIYIMFSYYVSPTSHQKCEIEEIIDYIIDTRKEMFEKYNIGK